MRVELGAVRRVEERRTAVASTPRHGTVPDLFIASAADVPATEETPALLARTLAVRSRVEVEFRIAEWLGISGREIERSWQRPQPVRPARQLAFPLAFHKIARCRAPQSGHWAARYAACRPTIHRPSKGVRVLFSILTPPVLAGGASA